MRWFSIDNPMFERFPPWMKRFGVSQLDGEVYLPAAIAGAVELVLEKAISSRVTPEMHDEHAYLPAQWLIAQFPQTQDVCRKLLTIAENARPTDVQCVTRYIELVAAAAELDDAVISKALDRENFTRRQITDATWFIPIALGRRVLGKKGMRLSDSFHVFNPEGERVRVGLFAEMRIYGEALRLRSPVLTEAVVKQLAMRSPEALGYREAVHSGCRPEDMLTVPIIFFTASPSVVGLQRAHEYALQWASERVHPRKL